MTELKPLTFLPQALIDAGFENPGYQSLFEAAQSGWIPADQVENGQWFFDQANLRFIAVSLLLEPVAA